MAREELARLLSRLPKRGQSARCCDDLAQLKSRLSVDLLHEKDSFRWVWVFASKGHRIERGIKSKCPSWRGEAPGCPRCQGRVVFAFIGAKRESLDRRSGRSRRRF